MTAPFFQIDDDTVVADIASYAQLEFKGSAVVRISEVPRTRSTIVQATGQVKREAILHCFFIGPSDATRQDAETFMQALTEQLAGRIGTLYLHGNSYPELACTSVDFDSYDHNRIVRYTIGFEMGLLTLADQKDVDGDLSFSRGTWSTFVTNMNDGSTRTFTFWNHAFSTPNAQYTVETGSEDSFENTVRIKNVSGGHNRFNLEAWVIGPATNNRKNLEAYFYNILAGPLGLSGTLNVSGNSWTEAVLESFNMEHTTVGTVRYSLGFIIPMHCTRKVPA